MIKLFVTAWTLLFGVLVFGIVLVTYAHGQNGAYVEPNPPGVVEEGEPPELVPDCHEELIIEGDTKRMVTVCDHE